MRIAALLVLAVCAVVAVERWICGRIMWAVGWLQR